MTAPTSPEGETARRLPGGLPGRGGRTRVPLLLLGLLIMLGAGLGFAVWSADLDERETVLVSARDISAGDIVTEEDVRAVDLGGATNVQTLPETALGALVGTTAVSDVSEGTVLNTGMFVEGIELDDDEVVISVVLEPGPVPIPVLRPNDPVSVISVGTEVSGEGSGEITVGRVLTARSITETATTRDVSVIIPAEDAEAFADAAAGNQIWLALLP